jgi:hypothetical protein
MEENFRRLGRPVVLLSITAPGEDRLPWDEAHCAHRRKHRHRGPSGCRVQQRAAREWADTCTWRWAKLRQAAAIATERLTGTAPVIVERVWEPQKRGVPHLHIVLPYGTPREIDVAHCFAAQLCDRASSYDFGYVDARADAREPWGRRLKPVAAAEAARYLSSYLTGRSRKKNSIRENIADPVMPRSLLWLTPKLTSRGELAADRRATFITMRTIRRARHLYAWARGLCQPPVWQSMLEAAKVALVCRALFTPRRQANEEDDVDPEQALGFAIVLERQLGVTWRYRAYDFDPFTFTATPTKLGEQICRFWLGVAGIPEAAAA